MSLDAEGGRPRIAILDYGVGNLLSVAKGVKMAGGDPQITRSVSESLERDALILPGVGAYPSAMGVLEPHVERLTSAVERGLWLLGICLGMELFFTESFEGGHVKGLDLLAGRVVELPATVKRPHIGWNTARVVRRHPFVEGLGKSEYFYFVHSYYGEMEENGEVLAETSYGVTFPAIVAKGRAVGTQFHPEKSGPAGLRLLKNFVNMVKEERR